MHGGRPSGEVLDQERPHQAERAADDASRRAQQAALDQELGGDVAPAGPERAADSDLAGPFRDARQHDVHDPDPAHQQADPGHRPRDHVEDALAAPALAEDLPRHQELERLSGREAAHHLLRDHGRWHHGSGRADPEDDLVDALGASLAASVQGGQRHQHAAVEVAGKDRAGAGARRRPALDDPHDLEEVAAQSHAPAEWLAHREERPRQGGAKHHDPLPVQDVEVAQEAARGEREPDRLAVGGCGSERGGRRRAAVRFGGQLGDSQRRNGDHSRYHRPQRGRGPTGQRRRRGLARSRGTGPHGHRVDPERLDLRERLPARPLPDRRHRHHRAHAEDDAQDRQPRAQAVEREAAHAEPQQQAQFHRGSSASIRPSRRRTTRRARRASASL